MQAKDRYSISELSVSETSDGSVTINIWKENGYSETYYMDKETAKFLWNRLGGLL